VKGRYIQDNFRLGQSSAKLLHARKKPAVLLKVDITRAFDSLIRRAEEWNLLQCLGMNMVPFRAALYADDLIMFAAPSGRDLSMVRTIFDIFEGASGLGCNMTKCQLVPIQYSEEHIQAGLASFPY
jgi:hypothetical protein